MKMYPLGSFGPLQRYIELNVPDRALTRPDVSRFPYGGAFTFHYGGCSPYRRGASADRCAWLVTGRYRSGQRAKNRQKLRSPLTAGDSSEPSAQCGTALVSLRSSITKSGCCSMARRGDLPF